MAGRGATCGTGSSSAGCVDALSAKGVPSLVRSFRLVADQRWEKVVALPGGFLAFGTRGLRATMVRGIWDGRMLSDSCAISAGAGNYPLVAPGHGSDGLLASLKPSENPRIGRFTLPRIDLFQDDLIVDTPAIVGRWCVGACRQADGTQGGKLAFMNAFEVKRAPIAILPAGNFEFAVFDSEGCVEIYRLAGE